MAKARIPKNLSVAELNKLQPGHGTTAQRSRIQRLLANPGTRHLLADRFLSPAQQQTRKTVAFNRTPVVPGSTVTNKDLASQRDAAASLKYGGAEAQAGRDIASRQAAVGQTGGYFDNYLAELRAHEANQAQINAQSQAATQGLAGSVQGLAQGDANVVSQGNQSLQAATGTAPASVTQDASNASMLRQALTASFGAMLAGQGANASGYADTLAHVVGPGQKLQGVTRAQGDVTKAQQARSDLAKEKGSFEQQFEDEFRQNEAKNVLAGQIAGVKSDQAQQQIDIQRGNQRIAARALSVNAADKAAKDREAARHNRAQEANTHRATTVSARNAKTRLDAQGQSIYTSGPFAGKSKAGVQAMSGAQRQQLVDAYNKRHPSGGKPKGAGKGPDWQTNAQQGQGASDAVNLKDLAGRARAGKPFVAGHAAQPPLDRHQAAAKIQQSAKIRDPILLTAALDAVYDGQISRATVRKLIAAGYRPSQIAQALGVPTPGQRPPGNPNIPSGKI
jgi:hypothetical protein